MREDYDVKLAVLEHEVAVLREQHHTHRREVNQSLREAYSNLAGSLKEITMDIKNIYEFIHRSRGSVTAVLLIASAIGGVVVSIVSWALGHFFR